MKSYRITTVREGITLSTMKLATFCLLDLFMYC
jgi:hypothetical protein